MALLLWVNVVVYAPGNAVEHIHEQRYISLLTAGDTQKLKWGKEEESVLFEMVRVHIARIRVHKAHAKHTAHDDIHAAYGIHAKV